MKKVSSGSSSSTIVLWVFRPESTHLNLLDKGCHLQLHLGRQLSVLHYNFNPDPCYVLVQPFPGLLYQEQRRTVHPPPLSEGWSHCLQTSPIVISISDSLPESSSTSSAELYDLCASPRLNAPHPPAHPWQHPAYGLSQASCQGNRPDAWQPPGCSARSLLIAFSALTENMHFSKEASISLSNSILLIFKEQMWPKLVLALIWSIMVADLYSAMVSPATN